MHNFVLRKSHDFLSPVKRWYKQQLCLHLHKFIFNICIIGFTADLFLEGWDMQDKP